MKNNKAWDILTQEEKSALTLTLSYGKSSWQAGEILKRAHYKYLEIQSRATHLFKIFTFYFEKTDNHLIPKDSDMTWDLQEYILCTIQNRMGYRDTIKTIGKESPLSHKKASKRVEVLQGYMDWLENHDLEVHRDLHDLIKEFDRWNNFRILPEELQEPSAFKRRNKTRLLKHLRNLKELDAFHIDRLTSKFKAPNSYKLRKLYLPIISETFLDGYKVLTIRGTNKIVNYISNNLQLYMFETEELADDYGHLVENYLSQKDKDCKQGQRFWPEFRTTITKAYNYSEINNIIPRRTNLETAFRDLDNIKVKKVKDITANDITDPSKRASTEKFWEL